MKPENTYGFIYITTNIINNMKYIGQKKYDNRGEWRSYLGSGKYLKRAIKKYGRKNFIRDIIVTANNEEELHNLEIEFIKKYNAVDNKDYYNIAEGGEYGVCLDGDKNPMYGRPWWNDNTPSEKIIKWKESLSRKGKDNPMYGISPKQRMDKYTYTIWKYKQTINKIGENNPNYKNNTLKAKYKQNPELKKLLSRNKEKNGRAKKVYLYDINKNFIKEFNYIGACANYLIINNFSKATVDSIRNNITLAIKKDKLYLNHYFKTKLED